MNILIDIGHPGQVHLFKYVIEKLKEKDHKVLVTVKDLPHAIKLLEAYQIPYISLGRKYDSILLKGLNQLRYDINLYKIAKESGIHIAVGSSMNIAHASVFSKMSSILLDDDDAEAVKLFSWFAHPFADCIVSPHALAHQRDNKKGITYRGTHELFYLHPKYFKPDISIVEEAGINTGNPFFILRFVSGKAYHDTREEWMTIDQKLKIINLVKDYGEVFITTERKIEPELEKWQLKVSPEKIHHLMYFATMFIGDSQTMTSEAAILGTPAIKCNTFAHKLSVPNMLEEKYKLCYSFQTHEFELMCQKIHGLLEKKSLKEDWRRKREHFISDVIDPTSFLVWFIEEYPESKRTMKGNPDYQYNFR
jgi:predicted glycosyltransferase